MISNISVLLLDTIKTSRLQIYFLILVFTVYGFVFTFTVLSSVTVFTGTVLKLQKFLAKIGLRHCFYTVDRRIVCTSIISFNTL